MILPEYTRMLIETAERYNLDWRDLAAIMDMESSGGRNNKPRYEPHLFDMSVGPFQVLTGTASWLVESGKVRHPVLKSKIKNVLLSTPALGIRGVVAYLSNPEVSAELGAAYLSWQLRRYDGQIEHAVAGYNAGSARLDSSGKFRNQDYVDGWREARADYSGIDADGSGVDGYSPDTTG